MPVRTLDNGETTAATRHLRKDPVLSALIDERGVLVLEPADDTFRRMVTSILRQQVSMESAAAIRERLFERFEITPDGLRAADQEALQNAGLSGQKAEYIQNLAEAYIDNGYGNGYFQGMSDDEVVAELSRIKGIGPWTAKMFLQFSLGRQDVFPVEDLGIRRAMRTLYSENMTRDEMYEKATDWQPYRSIASLYLWRHSG